MSILYISDLDALLLNHLNVFEDYRHLILTNKYYCNLIMKCDPYISFRKLYECNKKNQNPLLNYLDNLFINACRMNNSLCKNLLKTYVNINIHTNNECAFRWSCSNGHLEVAKWLLWQSQQNGFTLINIHAYNEWAFIQSCGNGHLEVARWLLWQSE